jgi:phospholipase C
MGVGPMIRSLRKRLRLTIAVAASAALAAGVAIGASAASASSTPSFAGYHTPALVSGSYYRDTNRTATPIKHLVVIFDENESFDHYFGTYPYAANTDGTKFVAKPGTPTINGLYSKITKSGPVGPLLTSNPNEYNPQRLTYSQALTSSSSTPSRTTAPPPARTTARLASSWTTTTATPSPVCGTTRRTTR